MVHELAGDCFGLFKKCTSPCPSRRGVLPVRGLSMKLFTLKSTLLFFCLMACDDGAPRSSSTRWSTLDLSVRRIRRAGLHSALWRTFFCNADSSCKAGGQRSHAAFLESGQRILLRDADPTPCEFNDDQGECGTSLRRLYTTLTATPAAMTHWALVGFVARAAAVPRLLVATMMTAACLALAATQNARVSSVRSSCTRLGSGGQCNRASPPPCAGCRPTAEGHQCCSSEFGESWFCGLEGICRPPRDAWSKSAAYQVQAEMRNAASALAPIQYAQSSMTTVDVLRLNASKTTRIPSTLMGDSLCWAATAQPL